MSSLTNTKIKDTYPALLKADDNGVIGTTEKVITDGLGNASVLSIGTDSASFSSDIEVNGLTIGKGNNDASTNTAFGVQTLNSNTTGAANTAVGYASLLDNTTGVHNVAVGLNSLRHNTSGENNVAIGNASLEENIDGDFNVALGSASLEFNTSGNNNTALGYYALRNNTASNNTAVGYSSLSTNTTGGSNTAVGLQVMQSNTTGGANTVVGMSALNDNTEGNRNTTLGFGSGNGIITGSDNVHIGYNTNSGASDVTNEIVIGASATGKGSNTALIGGQTIYLGDDTLGGVIVERAGDPFINLTDTSDSEVFQIKNNFAGGYTFYSTDTLDHTFFIGGSEKLRIGSSSVSVSDALSVTGNLTVDTNTLYVDASGNRVGIGISSPSFNLHVEGNALVKDKLYLQRASSGLNLPIASYWDGSVDPLTGTKGDILAIGNTGGDGLVFVNSNLERMRIDSSGNVGINTNPTAQLDVSSGATNVAAAFRSTDSGAYIGFADNTTSLDAGYPKVNLGALGNNLIFATENAERMRIDSSGNVGIGTSNPLQRLDVKGSHTTGSGIAAWFGSSNASNSGLNGGVAITTDPTGLLGGLSSTGTNAGLKFETNSAERMRITSGGYLKASDNAGYNIAGPFHEFVNSDNNWATFEAKHSGTSPFGEKISFTGASPNDTTRWFLNCSDSTTQRLYIWSNGNVQNSNNSYGAISDIKLKENIVDASPKLDDLLQVKIRNYNLIGDDKKQLGVVAQELEEVFPSMIDESPDFEEQEVIDEEGNVTTERVDLGTTTKSVKYSVFVPMLIKAIQELNAKVEALESQLNA